MGTPDSPRPSRFRSEPTDKGIVVLGPLSKQFQGQGQVSYYISPYGNPGPFTNREVRVGSEPTRQIQPFLKIYVQ
jgi:hypothetical protein